MVNSLLVYYVGTTTRWLSSFPSSPACAAAETSTQQREADTQPSLLCAAMLCKYLGASCRCMMSQDVYTGTIIKRADWLASVG